MLLAIDTTLTACSAALHDDVTDHVVASRFEAMDRGHAEALGPMIAGVFADAGLGPSHLSRIAVTVGPGTFTGIRIGLSYAKGMALALGVPLLGLTSLAATAAPLFGEGRTILVAHQAGGTGLYYWGWFDGLTGGELSPPGVAGTVDIAAAVGQVSCLIIGTGAAAMHQVLPHAVVLPGPAMPVAARFAAYAASLPAIGRTVEPLYLRPPDAKPSVSVAASSAQVRRSGIHDLAVMADIHARSFSKGWDSSELETIMSIPGAGALVVELAGTVYGFVQYQWVAGEAEINTVCVLPNYRRQGFGHDLMSGLMEHLKTLNTTKLYLDVAENNMAARELYRDFGFMQSGLRKAYYADGQNAVTMVKEMVA